MEIAKYIIEHNATVRQTAKEFGISKSTVHKDVTERLQQINPSLAKEARQVLDINKQERHIRGQYGVFLCHFAQHSIFPNPLHDGMDKRTEMRRMIAGIH